jgi:hypothetical protein
MGDAFAEKLPCKLMFLKKILWLVTAQIARNSAVRLSGQH